MWVPPLPKVSWYDPTHTHTHTLTGINTDPYSSPPPPLSSENNVQEELFEQILRGKLEFPSPDWDNISLPAKVHNISTLH